MDTCILTVLRYEKFSESYAETNIFDYDISFFPIYINECHWSLACTGFGQIIFKSLSLFINLFEV